MHKLEKTGCMTAIKTWAPDDRPREKMALKGTAALSNAELLAILINNGTRDQSALDLARILLEKCQQDLTKLGKMRVKEIQQLKIKGLGEKKAITIAAALELGLRRQASSHQKTTITSSKDIAQYLQSRLQYKRHELFMAIYLNRSNKIVYETVISEGGLTGTVADPRIILKQALEHDAVSIILSHNHPSGSLKPSKQDELLTNKIKQAALLMDIQVLDHIIVSEAGYFSFADEGLL